MTLDELYEKCKDCTSCHLRGDVATQTVPWEAGDNPSIMFVGDSPGKIEDKNGIPFQGIAGQMMDRIIHTLGLERGNNVHLTNVVKCRTPGNRNPTKKECGTCGALFLKKEIETINPKLIMCFGKIAAEYVLNRSSHRLTDLRDQIYKHGDTIIGVTFHPAYLVYNRGNEKLIKKLMWNDINSAFEAAKIEMND